MSNTYQKDRRRAQRDPLPGKVAVPEQVIVSMAETAGAAGEGPLALAVSTGLQVMTATFDEDVAGGPGREASTTRIAPGTGTAPRSATLGGRRWR